jgi:hypothetical protein
MNYSKAMIDLISEARRRVPSIDKPSIKLANPDVLYELCRLFHTSTDAVFKAIVKETFLLAGDPWPKKLLKPDETEKIKYTTRVYRGQTQLTEKIRENIEKPKTLRVYRGQVVT